MWERITAIGTVILIILTLILVSQGPAVTWLHWPWFILPVFVVGGLVIAAILNFRTAKLHAGPALPPKSDLPTRPETPRLDALARTHGIYIGSAGVAAQVIGDILTVRLAIFTCTMIELRFISVALNTGLGEILLESAEPHRIGPWMAFDKTFTKTLTADETKSTPHWASTVTLNGKAKFENNIEASFSIYTALSRPALSQN